jgi:hypothetical protein
LELGDSSLTPALDQGLARLGAAMPFSRAAAVVEFFTGTRVSPSTLRRRTLRAGALLVEADADEVERLEREAPVPPVPDGPRLEVSVDGAMVPVVGPEWVEVKTVAIGVVGERTREDGSRQPLTQKLSYFSRVAEAEHFTRSALVEMHRRGVERAEDVCAVNDGAVWIDGFVDTHRPDAVRILDFPHGAQALGEVAKAAYGEGSAKARTWFEAQRRELLEGDPARVLAAIERARRPARARGEAAVEQVRRSRAYLAERRERITYAELSGRGYPIGSGAVESANKIVVEARLKGAGMHWARGNLNAMLTLTNAVANERFGEAWGRVAAGQQQRLRRRSGRCAARTRARHQPSPAASIAIELPATQRPPVVSSPKPTPTSRRGPQRPAPDHPWQVPFSLKRRIEKARLASTPNP